MGYWYLIYNIRLRKLATKIFNIKKILQSTSDVWSPSAINGLHLVVAGPTYDHLLMRYGSPFLTPLAVT